jgi:hypothetical protein
MKKTETFGVFIDDDKGPIWCCGLNDIAESKRKAEEISTNQNVECFVYSFEKVREVARFYPRTSKLNKKVIKASE